MLRPSAPLTPICHSGIQALELRLGRGDSELLKSTESGILMEEFEKFEDDEDPNKPGPVEAYAFRACGKTCGTCE